MAPITEGEKEKLRQWLKKTLPDDWDKYDINAKIDSTLTYDENKSAIREDLKVLIKDLKSQVEYTKAQQEKLEHEKKATAEREAEEYNQRVFVENKSIDAYYSKVNRGINKLVQGYSNMLFVKGRGGIGKSYQIRKALMQQNADFLEICGEVTEAYLYRLIFENNGKVLWFKDVVKLLQNIGCLPYYTKIMTSNGIKDIKDIDPGNDKIASWNFKNSRIEYKSFGKWNSGMKKVIKIETENGEIIECSPEHKWIIQAKEGIVEKKAKDLNSSDVLLRLKKE